MKQRLNRSLTIRRLCEGALLIACAELLGFLPLYRMPWGGSVDLAMLPIFVFCTRWGFGPGMLVSVTHGILQTLFEGGIAIGWQSIIGDFLLAYAVLGVAGLFWKRKHAFYLGVLVGSLLRFLVHYVVGATVWASLMPETFFGMTMTTPWMYSAIYNGIYMVLDCALALIVGALLMRTSAKIYLRPYGE